LQQGDIFTAPPAHRKKFARADCIYIANGGMEEYNRPADNTQIVTISAVTRSVGTTQVDITKERSQSWTTFVSAGVDIFEIVSASVGFESSKSITDPTAYTFTVPEGQTGEVDL
jgi:hypothetical protein